VILATGVPGPSGVTVVPLAAPTAFVAGDRIVVSAALLDALDPAELDAVLAHETAHLRGGHSRIAAWAHALSRGSFQVPPARA
jgi:Zn-dependent protease with chaperone function